LSFCGPHRTENGTKKEEKREEYLSLSLRLACQVPLSLSLFFVLTSSSHFGNVQPRRDDAFDLLFFVRPTPILLREREEVNKFGGRKCLHGG